MTKRSLSVPNIGVIAATRVALGVGIGLLIADRFNRHDRVRIGVRLLTVGVVTTVPIVMGILGRRPFAYRAVRLAA